jgi:putative membrane protein
MRNLLPETPLWRQVNMNAAGLSAAFQSSRISPMKRIMMIVAAATLLSGAALAQSIGEKTGVNAALGVAPKTADFVKQAATSDMLEIQAAKIAQQKGNPEEQKFAAQMITDHTKTSDDIKALVASGTVKAEIPTALDSSAQSKLDKLNNAKPENFAATYDPMQVSAHKDAVSLFERYSKRGDNAKLKDWAGKTLPTLQHHLEMAQQMNDHRRNATVGSSSGNMMKPNPSSPMGSNPPAGAPASTK